ncbi:MAG: protein kinase [Alphaproteobacteria bacterium]|nr:protein kinase [Alphaproteobacteria bacterium]
MSARLGPFLLQDPLGQGAMGVVYRARHAEQGVPVAVKVDLASADPRANAAFLHEVQITAALDHPNVVMILDHGVVDGAASRATDGALVEGARWLAMELAPGGTAASKAPKTWQGVMHLMKGTLAGLAHAHARGVVHRDIKLQNLLLAGDEGSVASAPKTLIDSRVVVSDFGVSDMSDSPLLHSDAPIGTPQFMAPELIEGRWRDQGPWTDLYAVGVLLYLLTVRDFPFKGADRFETYRAHLEQPIPPFVPLMAVPEGLGDLVTALLSKAPGGRPEFAAEVQRALDGLGLPALGPEETTDFDETYAATVVTVPELPMQTTRSYATRSRGTLAEVPLLHGGRRRNSRMEGAGLALFGLRSVPFVGREAECDRLWNELVGVRTRQRARAVFLQGPSGIGKTRLAEWVAQRTHELGVAQTLRAHHEPGAPPGQGLVAMLRRELGTGGLDAAALERRLADRFGDVRFDLRALAATLEPTLYERPPSSAAELRQLVIAVLAELSATRPVLVVLDDVHYDLAALELVDSLLVTQELQPRPLLVVGTLRTEELVDVPEIEALLEELDEDPHLSRITLEPLDPAGRRRLIRSLLGLSGALAERIEERTQGNPLFAKQLIGAWVEQGVLRPGENGFELAPGHTGDLPSDVEEVWRSRLTDALAGAPPADVEALQVAAAWGSEVVDAYWRGACDVLGLAPSDRLFDTLRKRHLIHLEDPRGARWRFVHAALRELLVAAAKEAGSWRRHNLGIAVWLRESEAPVSAAQQARHFIEAEVWDEAIEPLCNAIHDQTDTGDHRSADLVDSLRDAIVRLGLDERSPEWAELRILESVRARARGKLDDAEEIAIETAKAAVANEWGLEIQGRSLREAARASWANGDYDRALTLAQRAARAFRAAGDAVRTADCEAVEGNVLVAKGRFDEAEPLYAHVIEVFEERAPERVPSAMLAMVRLNQLRGDISRTAAWLGETRSRAEPMGLQMALAVCANLAGELARAAGDVDAAAAHYREAIERFRAIESLDFAFPSVNLGILDVAAERYDGAIQRMQPLLLHLRRQPNDVLFTYTHMVLMAALAGQGDHMAAAGSLAIVRAQVAGSGLVDPDLAEMAEQTARLMKGHGWSEAREALELAIAQYDASGRKDDAARLRGE